MGRWVPYRPREEARSKKTLVLLARDGPRGASWCLLSITIFRFLPIERAPLTTDYFTDYGTPLLYTPVLSSGFSLISLHTGPEASFSDKAPRDPLQQQPCALPPRRVTTHPARKLTSAVHVTPALHRHSPAPQEFLPIRRLRPPSVSQSPHTPYSVFCNTICNNL